MAGRSQISAYPSAAPERETRAAYRAALTTLDLRRGQIADHLERLGKGPEKTLLARVARLADKYRPALDIPAAEPSWREKLHISFNLLSRKKAAPLPPALPAPDLLAEQTMTALRATRRVAAQASQPRDAATRAQPPSDILAGVARKEMIRSSLTLDYEKKNWGVERVCLDGIQNHLPSDARGTQAWVQCLVDQEWLGLAEARPRAADIAAVRFADDGVGFDVRNLELFYSTKMDEAESRGQFGEGMKMVAATAVREGLGMVLESQNWRATPRGDVKPVSNTRKGTQDSVAQLVFDVEHFEDATPIKGSRTIFRSPSPAFIAEVLQLPEKVPGLDPLYRPLFSAPEGQIVSTTPGRIFVKGIKVQDTSSVFSYNFDDVETNRDRNTVTGTSVNRRIYDIVNALDSKPLIKALLRRAAAPENARCQEFENYLNVAHPALWRESFYETFGKDAVLDTGFAIPLELQDRPVNRVALPENLKRMFRENLKIPTDYAVIPDYRTEEVPTSVTLEYGKEIWTEERMLLDAVQNHLPGDSGGRELTVRFRTTNGYWHPYYDLQYHRDEKIDRIKIADDGKGFDHQKLGLFYSDKGGGGASGKFGEGLKMLCAAALRANMPVVVQSREWSAQPRAAIRTVDGVEVPQMVFDVRHALKLGVFKDGDDQARYESSSTVFENPTAEFLREFRDLPEKVLSVAHDDPQVSTPRGDILSLDRGRLFVRQLLIPGAHQLKYSYHLKEFDIKTRDRNAVDKQALLGEVGAVWTQVNDKGAIKDFLYQATLTAQKNADLLEFQADFMPEKPAAWVEIFRDTFGSDMAMRDITDTDFNAVHQGQHMGLRTVTMPSAVYRMLSKCRDENGKGIVTIQSALREANDIEIIPDEELTEQEAETLRFFGKEFYPRFDPETGPIKIVAFTPRGDFQAAGLSGLPMKLNRNILSESNEYIGHVVAHEGVHNRTGAADADKNFRDEATHTVARLILEDLDHLKGEAAPAKPQEKAPAPF